MEFWRIALHENSALTKPVVRRVLESHNCCFLLCATGFASIGIYTTFTLPGESRKRACEFAERGTHGADCPNRVMIFRISPLLAGARLSPGRVNFQFRRLCRYRCFASAELSLEFLSEFAVAEPVAHC
jgi:hypothetical protein